ncbi:MAG: ubiquinol oxidase subunit II [Candidatus Lightella neohaematopini]|nr:ubiquinol oxidase subunit II [Candidatus Lightella neohaematopini]MCV2528923.1 ubiquinol oxidase subunit II [Candidatus Lightella neohaematopini]
MNIIKNISLLFFTVILFGCNHKLVVLNPTGQIGAQEKLVIITAIKFMLIIIIPVIIMTLVFITKYRSSNTKVLYKPEWCKSKILELFIWIIPIIIVLMLSNITIDSSEKLDPCKPILTSNTPIKINVISLNWKWLFIYPDFKIAAVNEMYIPINTPIIFNITSDSVMNSFFIPQLGSQIYAMSNMCSKLNLIANKIGIYKGISSNFSGSGFSGMKFNVFVVDNNKFNLWINKIKSCKIKLTNFLDYKKLSLPSKFNSVKYFSNVNNKIFCYVINKSHLDK